MAVMGVGGGLAGLLAESGRVKARLDTISAQVASGRRGTTYGDLGTEARRSIDLRAEIARREAHGAVITRALGRTGSAQGALDRMGEIAKGYFSEAMRISSADPARIETVAAGARQALVEVAGLLNATHAGEYLFGGTDTAHPPVPAPEAILSTGMATGIAAAIGGLASGGAAALAATRLAALSDAPADTPFSAYLSDPAAGLAEPRRTTLSADGVPVRTGLFANRNADAISAGETTGSWSRDLLRGLMSLAALQPAAAGAGAEFDTVMTGIREGLKSATAALGQESGALGLAESRLESAAAAHKALNTVLGTQLNGLEQVDLAEALTDMQATQTRLQASWKALAMISGLSIVDYLR